MDVKQLREKGITKIMYNFPLDQHTNNNHQSCRTHLWFTCACVAFNVSTRCTLDRIFYSLIEKGLNQTVFDQHLCLFLFLRDFPELSSIVIAQAHVICCIQHEYIHHHHPIHSNLTKNKDTFLLRMTTKPNIESH